jgi:hypothetical protein
MTDQSPQTPPGRDDSLLTPGPSALVAFSLAAVVLLGNNLMVQGTQSLFGLLFTGAYDDATFLVTWLVGALAPAAASAVLARRAYTDRYAAGWERTMGKAAFLLALVALTYTALMIVGGLIHDPF